MSKRPPSPSSGQLIKRSKSSGADENSKQIAISSSNDPRQKGLIRSVQRTSNLEAPIVSLAGAHSGEILSTRFSPSGNHVAAASADRSISLWTTYAPNTNIGLLSNLTKAPIIDLQWSLYRELIYAASADGTLSVVDTTTGQRVRKMRHGAIVNSVDRTMAGAGGDELVVTGGDDGVVKVWEGGDEGSKYPITTIPIGHPITCVAFSADGQNIFCGGLDNEIHAYPLREPSPSKPLYTLSGHTDTPTSLTLSPDGNFLLSPSLSSQVLIHDVRPFSPSPNRIHSMLLGNPAGWENTLLRGAFSKHPGSEGKLVAVGGADRCVCIWDVDSRKILYKLPGHKGTVTCVDWHPREPIVLSGSKDGTMILGEVDTSVQGV